MQYQDADTTVVLGAGPCGLALADTLTALGRGPVTVLERNPRPGGLARTFAQGEFRFDLSIHRFQVESPDFELDLEQLFEGQPLHTVEHKTIHIHLQGRRIPYPLRLRSLLSLPPRRGARALAQVARRWAFGGGPDPAQAESYRAWFEGTFGPTLYRWIAGPLMRKQWGLAGERLCASFAQHRRLSIAPRDLLAGLPLAARLAPRAAIAPTFVYGERGVGPLMERLAARLERAGGALRCATTPARLHRGDGGVRAVELTSGERLPCRDLISTIPLPALIELLDPPPPPPLRALARELRFRDLIVVALPLLRERVSRDHVTYFPEAGFPFSRTFEQKNASPAMAPPGRTLLGFELPCAAGDPLWSLSDDALIRWMAGFGPQLGFDERELEGGSVVRVREAYPLYERDHRQRVDALVRWCHHELDNCFLVGRNSLFRLDNMHHAISMGADLGRQLTRGVRGPGWQRRLSRYADLSYID
jgi:protoporphyrinogen oxidase